MKISIANRFHIDTESREVHLFEKRSAGLSVTNDALFGAYAPETASGVPVDEGAAMRYTAVWACVRLLSWSLADLPLDVFRSLGQKYGHPLKERAQDLPVYRLLHNKPNPLQTSFIWRSTAQAHAVLWGNSYSEIEFDNAGEPVALWPIPPWRCTPMLTENGRDIFYRVRLLDGTSRDIQGYRMLHVKGLTLNGLEGLSPIAAARQSIGLGLAAEECGARLFGQGLNMGGVITLGGASMTQEAQKSFGEKINAGYGGLGKTHRVMLLQEGMKYEKIGIPPEDAQFLETRKFQVTDTGRLFNVPAHMINDLERATFSNVEQLGIQFTTHTMMPWYINWEQEIDDKLLGPYPGSFSKFIMDALLRGDTLTRYQAYGLGRQWTFMSPNDIREKEDWNPVEDGNRYDTPANMLPIDQPSGKPLPKPGQPDDVKRSLLLGVVEKIVERECQNLTRAVERCAGKPAEFDKWVHDYYTDIGEFIGEQFRAVPLPEASEAYVADFTRRYAGDSRAALKAAVSLGMLDKVAAGWRLSKSRLVTECESAFLK